jgi:hypothetical protein
METSQQLVGFWKSDERPVDAEPQEGDVTIEFNSDGSAVYAMHYTDKIQKVFLTYKVEGDELVTDQPSHPLVMRTKFTLMADGSLILTFAGKAGRFLKRSVH